MIVVTQPICSSLQAIIRYQQREITVSNQEQRQESHRLITAAVDALDATLIQHGASLSYRQLSELYQRMTYVLKDVELLLNTADDQEVTQERNEWIGLHQISALGDDTNSIIIGEPPRPDEN